MRCSLQDIRVQLCAAQFTEQPERKTYQSPEPRAPPTGACLARERCPGGTRREWAKRKQDPGSLLASACLGDRCTGALLWTQGRI